MVEVPLCWQVGGFWSLGLGDEGDIDCYIDSAQIGEFYCMTDIVLSLVLLCAYFWLKYWEEQEVKALDKNTVFASMYTVLLKNLPDDCTEHELEDYVSDDW
tara:strand:+ start:296 stop:598 length:303 start_codon:yes stop_codon:yes gene_type:complete